jgi:hypothetical protein
VYTAANHYLKRKKKKWVQRRVQEEGNRVLTGYVTLAVGITPESRSMARREMAAYIQKNMTISFLPTAVYLLRMCKIIMAVMIMATMCTKHVAVGVVRNRRR